MRTPRTEEGVRLCCSPNLGPETLKIKPVKGLRYSHKIEGLGRKVRLLGRLYGVADVRSREGVLDLLRTEVGCLDPIEVRRKSECRLPVSCSAVQRCLSSLALRRYPRE